MSRNFQVRQRTILQVGSNSPGHESKKTYFSPKVLFFVNYFIALSEKPFGKRYKNFLANHFSRISFQICSTGLSWGL